MITGCYIAGRFQDQSISPQLGGERMCTNRRRWIPLSLVVTLVRLLLCRSQVALMRHQLKTVASAARGGPAKYASMVSNVVDIPKPQEAFQEEIDNSRDTPFVPKLREKPNAVTPLDLAPVSAERVGQRCCCCLCDIVSVWRGSVCNAGWRLYCAAAVYVI